MKINDWLKDTQSRLDENGIGSSRLDSLLLLSLVLEKDKEWLLANPNALIHRSKYNELEALVQKRLKHQPIAQLLGEREFYGRSFAITGDVLIPRPETEELVDYVIKNTPKGAKVLDMGTGSGCIAISTKLERPDLNLTATDNSKKALKTAKVNGGNLGAEIDFIESDLFSSIDFKFYTIAANLPYVPTNPEHFTNRELDFEPKEALFSGNDGLDHYRKFFKDASGYLSPGGFIIIEHDPAQFDALKELADLRTVSKFVSTVAL